MFEEQRWAIDASYMHGESKAMHCVAIYAITVAAAVKFAKAKRIAPYTVIEYSKPSNVRGETLVGAILLDPEQTPLVPDGLLQSLSTAAKLTKVRPLDLIKIYRDGKQIDSYLYDPSKWWCTNCHYGRSGKSCWKCGPEAKGYHPVAGLDALKMPDVKKIRELARQVGYCIAEHGSKERDLDLVAVPWTEEACDADELAEHLAKNLLTDNGPAKIIDKSDKPFGRKAYNIQLDGFYKLIDLSVTPKG